MIDKFYGFIDVVAHMVPRIELSIFPIMVLIFGPKRAKKALLITVQSWDFKTNVVQLNSLVSSIVKLSRAFRQAKWSDWPWVKELPLKY